MTGDVLDELQRRRAAGEAAVVATAVRVVSGAPPCRSGQKLLVAGGTVAVGTLGCAEFDAAALTDAAEVLSAGEPVVRRYEHDTGTVEVVLEPHLPPPTLVVLGATPVAGWLLRWGRDVGYRTVLVDPRPDRVTPALRDAADAVASSVAELDLAADRAASTAVVHTDHDAPGVAEDLAAAVNAGAGFVGMMSSRRHAAHHLERIRAAGADPAQVRAPLGLDLGGRSPQETALSILAGVVAARHDRDGGWLHQPAATPHRTSHPAPGPRGG